MKINKIITGFTPKGKKAGWYASYQPRPSIYVVDVYPTKKKALRAARFANDYQRVVWVEFLWGDLPLEDEIGLGCTINDYR